MTVQEENLSTTATAFAERYAAAQKTYADAMTVGFEQARLRYEQSQQTYAQEVHSLYGELHERSQQALQAYGQALSAAYTGAPSYEDCMREYRSYLEQLQQLFGSGDATQRHQAAYQKLVTQLGTGTTQQADIDAAGKAYQEEVRAIWDQQPMREQLEAAQSRYLELLKQLSTEASERQAEAWKALLAQLDAIWAQQDLGARTQGVIDRLVASAREALVLCHAAVEKSSAKAVDVLAAGQS